MINPKKREIQNDYNIFSIGNNESTYQLQDA